MNRDLKGKISIILYLFTSSTVNDDFDVEEYEEYESDEEGAFQQASHGLSELTPRSSRIVEKPYYLPLTDVPYPGEVESAFSLQRLVAKCTHKDQDISPSYHCCHYWLFLLVKTMNIILTRI